MIYVACISIKHCIIAFQPITYNFIDMLMVYTNYLLQIKNSK